VKNLFSAPTRTAETACSVFFLLKSAVYIDESRLPPMMDWTESGASTYRRTTAFTRLRRELSGNVPDHLGQLAGTDLVEKTI
jgi:hypothetical protein